jgi:hypothetical protein
MTTRVAMPIAWLISWKNLPEKIFFASRQKKDGEVLCLFFKCAVHGY